MATTAFREGGQGAPSALIERRVTMPVLVWAVLGVGDLFTEGPHPYEFMSGAAPDPAVGLPGVADVPMHFDKL